MTLKTLFTLFLSLTLLCFVEAVDAQNVPACVTDGQAKLAAALSKKPLDLAEVRSDAMMCIIENPSSAAALRLRARVELERGEFEIAIEWFSKAIKIEPANAEGYSGRGSAYIGGYRTSTYSRKDLKDLGVADLDKALQLDPEQAEAILARVKVKQDSMGSGYLALIPEFNKAVDIFRTRNAKRLLAQALSERGVAFSLATKYYEAINDFTEALQNDPTRYGDYMNRSIAHSGMKNTAAQLLDLTNLINSPEPTAFAYSSRGDIYEQNGELVKAVADYRAALKLDPSNGYIKERLPKLESQFQSAKPAANTGADAMKLAEVLKRAEGFAMEGRLHAQKGEFDAAIRAFDECIRIKPDAAPCYMFLGGVYAQKGNELFAFANLNRAVELAPKQPAVYFSRGMINAKFGKKNEAITDVRMVLTLDPNNQQAKALLAQLGVQP